MWLSDTEMLALTDFVIASRRRGNPGRLIVSFLICTWIASCDKRTRNDDITRCCYVAV